MASLNKRNESEREREFPITNKTKALTVKNLVDKYKSTQEKYTFLPDFLPHPPFRVILNGVSGNGKTNFLLNMIEEYYVDPKTKETLFEDGIYMFSPSIFTDAAYQALAIDKSKWVDEEKLQMFSDLDLEHLDEIVSTPRKKQCLVTIDDAAASKLLNNKKFADVFLRSRHAYVSWVISTQKLHLLYSAIITNSTDLFLWNVINEHEMKLNETDLATSKVNGQKLLFELSKLSEHEFLHENITKKKWYRKLTDDEIL